MKVDSPYPVKAKFPWLWLVLNAAAFLGLLYIDPSLPHFEKCLLLMFSVKYGIPASFILCVALWLALRRHIRSRLFWIASATWMSLAALTFMLYQLTPWHAREQAEWLLEIAEAPSLPASASHFHLVYHQGQRQLSFDLSPSDFAAYEQLLQQKPKLLSEEIMPDGLTTINISLEPWFHRVHLASWQN